MQPGADLSAPARLNPKLFEGPARARLQAILQSVCVQPEGGPISAHARRHAPVHLDVLCESMRRRIAASAGAKLPKRGGRRGSLIIPALQEAGPAVQKAVMSGGRGGRGAGHGGWRGWRRPL
jgi:hypothetical protein